MTSTAHPTGSSNDCSSDRSTSGCSACSISSSSSQPNPIEALARTRAGRLARFLNRRADDPLDAEDRLRPAQQDSAPDALHRGPSLSGLSQPETWLLGIARHLAASNVGQAGDTARITAETVAHRQGLKPEFEVSGHVQSHVPRDVLGEMSSEVSGEVLTQPRLTEHAPPSLSAASWWWRAPGAPTGAVRSRFLRARSHLRRGAVPAGHTAHAERLGFAG